MHSQRTERKQVKGVGGGQDAEGEATVDKRAILVHGMQERGGGGVPSTKKENGGHPPIRSAYPLCVAYNRR